MDEEELRGSLRFTVPGVAVPKARARTFNKDGISKTVTPKKTRDWEHFVSLFARKAMASAGLRKPIPKAIPVTLGCVFHMPTPPSWSKKRQKAAAEGRLAHLVKPDLSNLVKSIEDAGDGVIWTDDCQIVAYGNVGEKPTQKVYTDGEPKVEVEISWPVISVDSQNNRR